MRIRLKALFIILSMIVLTTHILNAKQYKIFISTYSIDPGGIFGSNGLNPDGFEFAFTSFYMKNVIYSSYPLVSPSGSKFARFEENTSGMKLIIRSTDNDSLINEIKISGYNPQWFPDGNNLFFETRTSGDKSACWKIDVASGGYAQIAELTNQYYPATDQGLGAAALSDDGRSIAYIRLSDTLSYLTPYIFDILSGKDKYAYEPDKDGKLDGESKRRIRIANGPAAPMTIRHLSYSSSSNKLAMYGTVSWDEYYDPKDTTKFTRASKSGIFVIDLNSHEITTIYKTANFFVEHPEVFFFSPNGNNLTFNTIIDNQNYVWFANPSVPNSARVAFPGYFITEQTSKMYWALNPWSKNGKKVLYRHDNDIWVSTPCGDETPITEFKQQVFIQDAQWADFDIAPTPEPGWTTVDPVPELIENDKVTSDIGLIQSSKHFVGSIAADGTAKIVIRFETGYQNPVKIKFSLEKNKCALNTTGIENEDGSLALPGDSTESGFSTVETISYDYNGSQSTALIYNAPLDFVRSNFNDDEKQFRTIEIAALIGEDVYHIPIIIFRPPLVLIHGTWSSQEIWDGFEPLNVDSYDPNSRFSIFRVDYSKRNSRHADEIVGRFDHGVVDELFESINYFRNKPPLKTACVKADVVGHSLGGLIARSMPIRTAEKYFRKENYKKGMIHKLITIDTPHLGTEYADALIGLYNKSLEPGTTGIINTAKFEALEKMMNLWGAVNPLPISGGAVHDQQPNSEYLHLLNDTNNIKIEPPIHTIVGIASDQQVLANHVYIAFFTEYSGKGFGGYFSVFGDKRHDLIVSEFRQSGNFDLNENRITTKSGVTHSDDYFLANSAVGKNAGNALTVINLLNSPRNSKYFTTNGRQFGNIDIPAKENYNIVNPNLEKKEQILLDGKKGIKITYPLSGTKFNCGDTILLKAEQIAGFNLIRAYASGLKSIQVDSIPPFEFNIKIPFDFPIGKTDLMVIGVDSSGNFAYDLDSNNITETIKLDVATTAILDSLKISGKKNLTFRINQLIPDIYVKGFFNDSIIRNISKDPQTSYFSTNPSVGVVEDGIFKINSIGVANIIVSNLGKSDTLILDIKPDNLPPIADAGNNMKVIVNSKVTLDGSNSSDPNGDDINFIWNIWEKPKNSSIKMDNIQQKIVSFIPDVTGYFIFKLTVTDKYEETSEDFISVYVISETENDDKTKVNNSILLSSYYDLENNKINIGIQNNQQNHLNIYISDIFGRVVGNVFFGYESNNFNIAYNCYSLAAGCYFIVCESSNGKVLNKIIKPL